MSKKWLVVIALVVIGYVAGVMYPSLGSGLINKVKSTV